MIWGDKKYVLAADDVRVARVRVEIRDESGASDLPGNVTQASETKSLPG